VRTKSFYLATRVRTIKSLDITGERARGADMAKSTPPTDEDGKSRINEGGFRQEGEV
jgi:hypothetical protein